MTDLRSWIEKNVHKKKCDIILNFLEELDIEEVDDLNLLEADDVKEAIQDSNLSTIILKKLQKAINDYRDTPIYFLDLKQGQKQEKKGPTLEEWLKTNKMNKNCDKLLKFFTKYMDIKTPLDILNKNEIDFRIGINKSNSDIKLTNIALKKLNKAINIYRKENNLQHIDFITKRKIIQPPIETQPEEEEEEEEEDIKEDTIQQEGEVSSPFSAFSNVLQNFDIQVSFGKDNNNNNNIKISRNKNKKNSIFNMLKECGLLNQTNKNSQSYLDAFSNNVGATTVDDLKDLSLDELKQELNAKTVHWNKLEKMLNKHNITLSSSKYQNTTPGSVNSLVNKFSNKKGEISDEEKEDRITFSDGIHYIETVHKEYIVPEGDKNSRFSWLSKKHEIKVVTKSRKKTYSLKSWSGICNNFKKLTGVFNNIEKESNTKELIVKTDRPNPLLKKIKATKNHKVILICGKTGAGKSTLINSMINYIYGVKYSDKFRLKLISEKPKSGQHKSQTDHISSYFIKKPKGGRIKYDLTIIDTPGFGDVRGLKKDKQIAESFKYIFEHFLDRISGICFIVKASDNRLDSSQTYVFNNILNLWAKDVLENICTFITFAGRHRPSCMDALQNHEVLKQCTNIFKVDNEPFFEDVTSLNFDPYDDFGSLAYNAQIKNLSKFFKKFETLPSKSIEESKKVVQRRYEILNEIRLIEQKLDKSLMMQENIQTKKKKYEENEDEIQRGAKVVWYEKQDYQEKQYTSDWNYECSSCTQKTCHAGCIAVSKWWCCVISSNKCKVCGHNYSSHEFNKYKWVTRVRRIEKNNEQLLHLEKQERLEKFNQEMQDMEKASQRTQNSVDMCIKRISGLQNELERIALRPKLSTIGDQIDKLIEMENEKPQRDKEKIQLLKDLKKREKIILQLDEKKMNTSYHDLQHL